MNEYSLLSEESVNLLFVEQQVAYRLTLAPNNGNPSVENTRNDCCLRRNALQPQVEADPIRWTVRQQT